MEQYNFSIARAINSVCKNLDAVDKIAIDLSVSFKNIIEVRKLKMQTIGIIKNYIDLYDNTK